MDVEKLKVTELKAALTERGLDTKGNKAALLERLQGVLTDDNNDKSNDKVEPSQEETNGKDSAIPETEEIEEENEEEEDEEEPGVPGNEDGTTFSQQEFVRSKPVGISFGLHEPTKVKPQPKELTAPAPVTGDPARDSNNSRAGAADFFSGKEVGGASAEAAVPLPPSTSFLEESEEEEEEAPPGVGDVELPVAIFNKVRSGKLSAALTRLFDGEGGSWV